MKRVVYVLLVAFVLNIFSPVMVRANVSDLGELISQVIISENAAKDYLNRFENYDRIDHYGNLIMLEYYSRIVEDEVHREVLRKALFNYYLNLKDESFRADFVTAANVFGELAPDDQARVSKLQEEIISMANTALEGSADSNNVDKVLFELDLVRYGLDLVYTELHYYDLALSKLIEIHSTEETQSGPESQPSLLEIIRANLRNAGRMSIGEFTKEVDKLSKLVKSKINDISREFDREAPDWEVGEIGDKFVGSGNELDLSWGILHAASSVLEPFKSNINNDRIFETIIESYSKETLDLYTLYKDKRSLVYRVNSQTPKAVYSGSKTSIPVKPATLKSVIDSYVLGTNEVYVIQAREGWRAESVERIESAGEDEETSQTEAMMITDIPILVTGWLKKDEMPFYDRHNLTSMVLYNNILDKGLNKKSSLLDEYLWVDVVGNIVTTSGEVIVPASANYIFTNTKTDEGFNLMNLAFINSYVSVNDSQVLDGLVRHMWESAAESGTDAINAAIEGIGNAMGESGKSLAGKMQINRAQDSSKRVIHVERPVVGADVTRHGVLGTYSDATHVVKGAFNASAQGSLAGDPLRYMTDKVMTRYMPVEGGGDRVPYLKGRPMYYGSSSADESTKSKWNDNAVVQFFKGIGIWTINLANQNNQMVEPGKGWRHDVAVLSEKLGKEIKIPHYDLEELVGTFSSILLLSDSSLNVENDGVVTDISMSYIDDEFPWVPVGEGTLKVPPKHHHIFTANLWYITTTSTDSPDLGGALNENVDRGVVVRFIREVQNSTKSWKDIEKDLDELNKPSISGNMTNLAGGMVTEVYSVVGNKTNMIGLGNAFESDLFKYVYSYGKELSLVLTVVIFILLLLRYLRGKDNAYVLLVFALTVFFIIYWGLTGITKQVPNAYNFFTRDIVRDLAFNGLTISEENNYIGYFNFVGFKENVNISGSPSLTMFKFGEKEFKERVASGRVSPLMYDKESSTGIVPMDAGFLEYSNMLDYLKNPPDRTEGSKTYQIYDELRIDVERLFGNVEITGEMVSVATGEENYVDSYYQYKLTKLESSNVEYFTPYYQILENTVENINRYLRASKEPPRSIEVSKGLNKSCFALRSYFSSILYFYPQDLELLTNLATAAQGTGVLTDLQLERGQTLDMFFEDILSGHYVQVDFFKDPEFASDLQEQMWSGDSLVLDKGVLYDYLGLYGAVNPNNMDVKSSLWYMSLVQNGYEPFIYDKEGKYVVNTKFDEGVRNVNTQTSKYILNNFDNFSYISDSTMLKIIALYGAMEFATTFSDYGYVINPHYVNISDMSLNDLLKVVLVPVYDRYNEDSLDIPYYVALEVGAVGLLLLLLPFILVEFVGSYILNVYAYVFFYLFSFLIIFKMLWGRDENEYEIASKAGKGILQVLIIGLALAVLSQYKYIWAVNLGSNLMLKLIVLFSVSAVTLAILLKLFWKFFSNLNDFGGVDLMGLGKVIGKFTKDREIKVNISREDDTDTEDRSKMYQVYDMNNRDRNRDRYLTNVRDLKETQLLSKVLVVKNEDAFIRELERKGVKEFSKNSNFKNGTRFSFENSDDFMKARRILEENFSRFN